MKLIEFEGCYKTYFINPEYVSVVHPSDNGGTIIKLADGDNIYSVKESTDDVVAKLMS